MPLAKLRALPMLTLSIRATFAPARRLRRLRWTEAVRHASLPSLAEPRRPRKLGSAEWKGREVKGILGRLFGGGGGGSEAKPGDAVEYNGFRIRPAPYQSGGQYQTAGVIEKDFPDGTKEHRFIRAETHASKDDAAAFAISKGQQIIDERGDKIFDAR